MWSTASAPEETLSTVSNEASGIRTRTIRATAGYSCRLSYSPSVIRRRSTRQRVRRAVGVAFLPLEHHAASTDDEIRRAGVAWYCFRSQTITCQSASGARSADTTSVNALVANAKRPTWHTAQAGRLTRSQSR